MADLLEMPEPPAGLGLQRDDGVCKKVPPAVVDTDKVGMRRAGREVGNAALLVHSHAAPAVCAERRLLPLLVSEFALARDDVERPQQLAGHDVETLDLILHRNDDNVFVDRRGDHAACGSLPPLTEAGHRCSGLRVERVQISSRSEQNARSVLAVALPVNQAAMRRPPFRLETPELLSSVRPDGDHMLAHRRRVQDAVHSDRIALDVPLAVFRVIDPGHLQGFYISAVNLIQGGKAA